MPESLTTGIPHTVETDEPLVNETFGSNNIYRLKTGARCYHSSVAGNQSAHSIQSPRPSRAQSVSY
jgi:hypothetical protein